jgi:hypothetical protein
MAYLISARVAGSGFGGAGEAFVLVFIRSTAVDSGPHFLMLRF